MPERSQQLNYRQIYRLYWPLAVSWLFMSLESPVVMAIVARGSHPAVYAAGFLILMGISIWIESPAIDLLSTSTALGRNRSAMLRLRGYTLLTMAWVTLAHAAVAFTPLYDVLVYSILGLDRSVGEAVRVPLMIMTPWSALIGWRRHLQGLMIRHGATRPIVVGTTLRLAVIAGLGFALFFTTHLGGLIIAAIALIASVAAESMFVWIVVQPTLREQYGNVQDPGPELPWSQILRFHLPLTATTMVNLTTGPLVGAALARTVDSVDSMASWQFAITLVGLIRTMTFALPEAIIALYDERRGVPHLRRFSFTVGASLTGFLAFVIVTGLDQVFFVSVLGTPERLLPLTRWGVFASALLPMMGSLVAFYRGSLAAEHATASRFVAILAGTTTLAASLIAGVVFGVPGVVVAGGALTLSQMAESAVLGWSTHRVLKAAPRYGTT